MREKDTIVEESTKNTESWKKWKSQAITVLWLAEYASNYVQPISAFLVLAKTNPRNYLRVFNRNIYDHIDFAL